MTPREASKRIVVKSSERAKSGRNATKNEWIDDKAKKIVVKFFQGNIRKTTNMGPGVLFPDIKIPIQIVELLKTHPQIDQFEAEFAVYMTDQRRKDGPYDIKELLEFCLRKPQKSDKNLGRYDFDYS